MKKLNIILVSVSILILCIVQSSFADDFSVRNGIRFGMTIDEVKQIETRNGITDSDIYLDKVNGDYYCFGLTTSIAGIDGSRLLYQFDPDTKLLIDFRYMLGPSGTSIDLVDEYFKTVSQSLINKYGEPLHSSTTDGIIFPLLSNSMKSASNDRIITYYQWLVDFNDYYILIDAIRSDNLFLPKYPQYDNAIGYKYVLKEDAEKALQDFVDEQNQREQRIEDETNRDL